ncbi:MAG: signal peptide peptidase SppA [Candidatus Anstonellales archaeon]
MKKSDLSGWKYVIVGFLGLGFVLLLLLLVVFTQLSGKGIFGKCVGVVNIDGEITVEGEEAGIFSIGKPGSEEMAKTIEGLNKRDDVGAVVIVVNSPGGSVVGTREVYSAVKDLKKPKVAYLREVAASGGYYVASGADYIIADPNTLTGSIGVIATVAEFSELFDMLGINFTSIKSGEHKDIGSIERPMSDEEREILQGIINETFEEFKGVVIENRGKKIDRERMNEIFDGRIMSGRQAYSYGLVDELGSKEDALKKAAEMGGIEYEKEVPVCEIEFPSKYSGGIFGESFLKGINEIAKKKISIEFK